MSDTLQASRPELRAAIKSVALVILGVALITLAAKIRIPSWPVPMTLHTFAVMAIAVAAGPRLATATFVAYLAAGAAGLPVFSGTPERGIGLAYMVGPTGGYLLGYLVASWITGTLALGRATLGRAGAMLAGLAITYAVGLGWLALYVPARDLLAVGLVPFLLSDLTAVALVALGAALLPARLLGSIGQ
jgi:biotin transport system substrate-specific component